MGFLLASSRFPNRPRPRRRSRPRFLILGISDFVIKAVIDRADRLVPLACKEVEDENEDEDDWGSRGRELRPHECGCRLYQSDRSIGSALLQDARPFPYRVPACFIPSQIVLVLVVVLVLGLWLEACIKRRP